MQLFFGLCIVVLQCISLSVSIPFSSNLEKNSEPRYNFPAMNDANKRQDKPHDLDKRQECVDKRNCTWVRVVYRLNTQEKLEEFCEKYKVLTLIKQCAKTCGHCKPPAPPAPEPLKTECKDERDCSALPNLFKGDRALLDEYCDAHKQDEPIKQCRYTCGFCKAPAPAQCKDDRSDCNRIIEINKGDQKVIKQYCDYWLAKNDPGVLGCKKTCGACGKAPSPPRQVECKDERSDCHRIIEINKGDQKVIKQYCDHWLAKNDPGVLGCKKTCGACGKAPSPPRAVECKDERDCHSIVEMFKGDTAAMQRYCDLYILKKDPTILACRRTCGACKAPAEPEPVKGCEDTRVGGCSWITETVKDRVQYCEDWKDDVAVKECQKTCGFCK